MENDENHPLECLDEDRAPHRSQLGSHLDTIALRSEIHEEREPTVSGLEVARLNPARALANRGSSAEPQVLQGARNFDILGGSFLTAQSITYNITQLSPPPESHPRDTMYSPHLLQESNPERPRIPDREHVLSQHQANSSPFSLRTTSSHGASSHLNEVPLRETVTEGRSSSFLPVQPEEHIPRPTGQNPVLIQLPPTNHPAVPLPPIEDPNQLNATHLPQSPPPSPNSARRSFPTQFSAGDLYTRLMLAHCPGYPLWCPGPNLSEHLPVEYRKDGVSIGDIGLIRDGLFDFVFNFLRPANHPINGRGNFTPDGFVPCAWSGDMVQNRLGRGTQFKTLSVESINVPQHTEFPSSFSFQIRTSPSAICAMPRGALTTKMLDLGEVEEFITTHALEWYQYIGGRRKLQNGELYAITGTTKSDSWGLYVVDDIPQADGQIVTFGKLPGGPPRYYWSGERISGTVKHRDFEDPFFEEPNQAVFVTGFRIFLGRQYLNLFGPPKGVRIANIQDHRPGERGSTWIPFSRTAGMGQQSTREENVPGSTHPSRIDQVTRSPASNSLRTTEFASTAAGQTERRSQGQGSQSAVGKMEPCSSQVGIKDCEAKTVDPSWTLVKAFDPATEIQEHLLAVFPQAAVVIIHDHQWLSVLHPNDLTPPSTHDLWNRIKLRYTPFLKDGVAVLRPKDIGNHGEIEDGSCAELNKPFFEVNARICPEFACLTPPPSRRQTEDTPAALNQCQVLSY